MIVLGIETSCDDTCAAILKVERKKSPDFDILSNIVSSQIKLHAKYGGVYPFLAKREHQKNLPLVFKKALKNANFFKKNIDLIAVTVGPGLEPCLWTGVNFAKRLAEKIKVPLVPVNHIEAHIFANLVNLKPKIKNQKPKKIIFPAVCLIVSGGHTELILMKKIGSYKILGETRDDAAGECFDKTARILGLGYPGGPAIAAQATILPKATFNKSLKLPRPMIHQKNYDFSFSGLKTAVLYLIQKLKNEKTKEIKNNKKIISLSLYRFLGSWLTSVICAEIQQAIIDVLIHKTLRAAKEHKAKTIILGGGVAANKELRQQLAEIIKRETPSCLFLVPPPQFCIDNAVMVAAAGYFNWLKNKNWKKIEANANLKIGESL